MQPSVPSASIPKRIVTLACLLASAGILAPLASAQRPVANHAAAPAAGHVIAPPRVPVAPHVPATPRPSAPAGPHGPIAGPQNSFHPGPILIRHRVFVRAPFFLFRERFYSGWWLPCGPDWTWQYNCNGLPYYGPPPENYVQQPVYEYPQYVYPEAERALVRLYLKDGTVYSVTDYWFVNEQLHFFLPDEEDEQVIALDELDLQKTIDVNTRRGFRFVMRNEPLQQYLRDHPNDTPPLVQPPPKN
jgi:hypothetical protein